MLRLGVSSERASRWTCPQRVARPPVQSPGVGRGWHLEPTSLFSVPACSRWVPESREGRAWDTGPASGSCDNRRGGREAARLGWWGEGRGTSPCTCGWAWESTKGLRGIQQGRTSGPSCLLAPWVGDMGLRASGLSQGTAGCVIRRA